MIPGRTYPNDARMMPGIANLLMGVGCSFAWARSWPLLSKRPEGSCLIFVNVGIRNTQSLKDSGCFVQSFPKFVRALSVMHSCHCGEMCSWFGCNEAEMQHLSQNLKLHAVDRTTQISHSIGNYFWNGTLECYNFFCIIVQNWGVIHLSWKEEFTVHLQQSVVWILQTLCWKHTYDFISWGVRGASCKYSQKREGTVSEEEKKHSPWVIWMMWNQMLHYQ